MQEQQILDHINNTIIHAALTAFLRQLSKPTADAQISGVAGMAFDAKAGS
jgi:hypothetical protein